MIDVSVHILAAVVLIGHMLFWTVVVGSANKRFDPAESNRLLRHIIRNSGWINWACLSVLIITGISMLSDWHVTLQRFISGQVFLSRFGQVLGAKLFGVVLVMIGFFFVGPRTSRLFRFNLFVALMVVLLSVVLVR